MGIKAQPATSLADQLFNRESVAQLAASIAAVHDHFPRKRFVNRLLRAFPELALKQRIERIVDELEAHLPSEFTQALDVLGAALPPPLDPARSDDDFGEFIWVVPGEYVARHGCSAEHLDAALAFLREATKRFSSEGAIRPFLRDFPQATLAFVRDCTADPNYHVRRLASEGTRPFLPWALRVELPRDEVLGILDALHADSTRYVTRSVANALNDISKIDPDAVLETLRRWRGIGRQQANELDWMTRHALRTLTKQGYAEALELLGYPSQPAFSLGAIDVSREVRIGDSLLWRGRLRSRQRQNLKLALRIHFLKADGSHSVRVFAVKDVRLGAGEILTIEKRLPFKAITTRTLYPGTHHVDLSVNGVCRGKRAFELTD